MAIHAALGGPWDVMGDLIKRTGTEDSSGLRRCLASLLARRDYEKAEQMLGGEVRFSELVELRAMFVREYGEPE